MSRVFPQVLSLLVYDEGVFHDREFRENAHINAPADWLIG